MTTREVRSVACAALREAGLLDMADGLPRGETPLTDAAEVGDLLTRLEDAGEIAEHCGVPSLWPRLRPAWYALRLLRDALSRQHWVEEHAVGSCCDCAREAAQ